MSTRQETNVRLLPCVLEALTRIAVRREISRDEAVRQVLSEHVAAQEKREPEDRLTHISTVLRYPSPTHGGDRVDRPLRLRLPAGMADRARAVSLRLPGQHQRAYKDYQARSLTDAVVTAIAVQEFFTDSVLDGLLPLLRHKAALGLWQLVVAATSSRQELAVQDAADHIRAFGPRNAEDDRLLLVAEALDDEVSWHSRVRFDVAAHLASENLRGDGAAAYEETLFTQKAEWHELLLDRRFSRHGMEWFEGVPKANMMGRSATALWRAMRKVELQDFEDWLRDTPGDHAEERRLVNPPGWTVSMPIEWHAVALSPGGELPTQFARWAEVGQVLVLPFSGRRVVWPLSLGRGSPAAGAEPLVAAARTLKSQDLTSFVEAMLVEWGMPLSDSNTLDDKATDDDEPETSEARRRWATFDAQYEAPQLWIPVDKAFRFGFVDATQRRDAMAAARLDNLNRPSRRRTGEPSLVAPLVTADPQICLFIPRLGKNRCAKPMWRWPGGSVARATAAQTDPELVRCLANAALWTTRWTLHRTMRQVWHAAFQ